MILCSSSCIRDDHTSSQGVDITKFRSYLGQVDVIKLFFRLTLASYKKKKCCMHGHKNFK